jgi:hypothetical protein
MSIKVERPCVSVSHLVAMIGAFEQKRLQDSKRMSDTRKVKQWRRAKPFL